MTNDPLALLHARRSRPALAAPAPDADQLDELLRAACAAPDHGRLRPWRFVVIDSTGLDALGDAFAAATAERRPSAGPAELAHARAKARRAPMIVVVVGTPRPHPIIPVREQRAAATCVAYGLTLAAHARGFATMWRSGWYGGAPKVRVHLGLSECEEVTAWVYLGTAAGHEPPPRPVADPPVTWLR